MQKMAQKILQNCRNLGCLQMQNFQRKKLQNVEFCDKKVVELQIFRAVVDVEFEDFSMQKAIFQKLLKMLQNLSTSSCRQKLFSKILQMQKFGQILLQKCRKLSKILQNLQLVRTPLRPPLKKLQLCLEVAFALFTRGTSLKHISTPTTKNGLLCGMPIWIYSFVLISMQ